MFNSVYTVWLADDDEDDRMLLRDAFAEIAPDLKLVIFIDGLQLLDQLHSSVVLPDLILLDINMPKKTGFDCLAEIKSSPKLSALAAMVWSTGLHDDFKKQAFKLGARLAIQKPNSFERVQDIVKKITTVNLSKPAVFDNDFFVE